MDATTSNTDTAKHLAALGLAVFPCKWRSKDPATRHGCKDATCDPTEIERMFRPGYNIGVATGNSSGIWVLDLDGSEGLEAASAIEERYGSLPITVCQMTGGGGKQFFFRLNGQPVRNRTKIGGKPIDVRGEGGYIVVPPSIHPSGNQYEWINAPGTVPIAPAPGWLIDLVTSREKPTSGRAGAGHPASASVELDAMARAAAYVARIPTVAQGERNATAFRVACTLARDFGLNDVDAWLVLSRWNARCAPPLEEDELRTILKSARENGKHPIGAKLEEWPDGGGSSAGPSGGGFPLTEYGNAQRLVRMHGDKVRFDAERGSWLAWDGRRWAHDITGESVRLAKGIVRSFWKEAASCSEETRRKALIQHANRSEKANGIQAMLKLASTEPGIGVASTDLDADRFLLNVLSGTVELRTGELRPHRQLDLVTKLAPVEYRPDASSPLWDAFLNRIMDGNAEMISYLSRIAGVCLTGDVSVQELFIFWGGGANGKSVFLDTLLGLLGEYASLAPDSLLTARSHEEHPTEIADLRGRRLVVASETEQSSRLRISMVKRLTGDRTLKGRFMRQDYFEFARTHKTILVTNNRPIVREQTQAVWRRIRLIPFAVTIPEAERDPHLIDKLRDEWPGILAWAVRGCLDWQRGGMRPPHEVLVATKEYQTEQDVFNDFIADCLPRGPERRISRHAAYNRYLIWAERVGEKPISRAALYEQLRRVAGVEEGAWRDEETSSVTRGFDGIGDVPKREKQVSWEG